MVCAFVIASDGVDRAGSGQVGHTPWGGLAAEGSHARTAQTNGALARGALGEGGGSLSAATVYVEHARLTNFKCCFGFQKIFQIPKFQNFRFVGFHSTAA